MFIICYEPIDFDYERILQVSTTKEVEDTIMDLMTNSSYTVEKYGHGHYGEIKNIRVYETTHALPEFENFIKENNVPYNSLHDKGYVSIGCEPCTRPVKPGEDFRAGRWWWENDGPKECGCHVKG